MADLVRTLEADLFGAHAWAAELYQELLDVEEPEARVAVAEGLLRALDTLEHGEPVDAANRAPVAREALAALSTRAAEVLAAAEDAVPEKVRAQLAPLSAPRAAFLASPDEATARAFLAAFDPLWERGPREPLVVDGVLAALARSNVLEPRLRGAIPPQEGRRLHGLAARAYEDVAALLRERVARGGGAWEESVSGALNRAARLWHLAGEPERSRDVDAEARAAMR